MSLPVIDATQSYAGFRQYESFVFKIAIFMASGALNVTATGLPGGLSLNAATGEITGSIGVPGIYNFQVRADDSGGNLTAATTFTFVIDPASGAGVVAGSSDTGVDLDIDVVTKAVTLSGVATEPTDEDEPALFTVKLGDVQMLNLRFWKNGVQLDPNCSSSQIKFAIKEFDPEATLLTADTSAKSGTGAAAFFQLPVAFTGAPLETALSNYEANNKTAFRAYAEIEWKQTITSTAGVTLLQGTTQTFRIEIVKDLVPA